MSDILRDFKKYNSKKVVKAIIEENESRREWILYRFEYAGKYNYKIKDYKFWQDGNEAKEIISNEFLDQKLNYIHQNPFKARIVDDPEHYIYSSAIDYGGGKSLLNVIIAV